MKELKCPKCGKVGYSSWEGNVACEECWEEKPKIVLSLSHGFLDVVSKPMGVTIELHDFDDPEYDDGRPIMWDADEVVEP